MADNILAQRASEAFATLVMAVAGSVPVIAGENVENRAIDQVACNAVRDEEYPLYTGNFWVMAKVQIQTNASKQPGATVDPDETHFAMVTAITNALEVDDIADQLTAAANDFTVFPGTVHKMPEDIEGNQIAGAFRNTLNFKFIACASDLS